MKKLKFLLPLIAIMLIVVAGVWAMNAHNSSSGVDDTQTWIYIGPPGQSTSDLNTASNYTPAPFEDVQCASRGSLICSIEDVAASNGTEPALSYGSVTLTNTDYKPQFKDPE